MVPPAARRRRMEEMRIEKENALTLHRRNSDWNRRGGAPLPGKQRRAALLKGRERAAQRAAKAARRDRTDRAALVREVRHLAQQRSGLSEETQKLRARLSRGRAALAKAERQLRALVDRVEEHARREE